MCKYELLIDLEQGMDKVCMGFHGWGLHKFLIYNLLQHEHNVRAMRHFFASHILQRSFRMIILNSLQGIYILLLKMQSLSLDQQVQQNLS
jgi:hypothetical protein